MTVDYYKLNQVVTPIAAAVPDVASLLEQNDTSPMHGMQLLIWKMLFSPHLLVKTRSSLLSAAKATNIPSLSYFRGILTLQTFVTT